MATGGLHGARSGGTQRGGPVATVAVGWDFGHFDFKLGFLGHVMRGGARRSPCCSQDRRGGGGEEAKKKKKKKVPGKQRIFENVGVFFSPSPKASSSGLFPWLLPSSLPSPQLINKPAV